MKKFLSLAVTLFSIQSLPLLAEDSSKEVSVMYEAEDYSYQGQTDTTWTGPGYYFGNWYNTETEYNNARRQNTNRQNQMNNQNQRPNNNNNGRRPSTSDQNYNNNNRRPATSDQNYNTPSDNYNKAPRNPSGSANPGTQGYGAGDTR